MANRYATKSGNWSDVTVWDGGITLPGVGDVVRSNGYGVTVDQDITVDTLRNDAASPANAGGYFVVSSMPTGRKITANLVATGERLVSLTASNPTTLEIWGNVQGGSVTNAYGVRITSAAPKDATVSVVGDVVGGSAANAVGVMLESAATVIVTGDLTSGSVATATALYISSSTCYVRHGTVKTVSGLPVVSGQGSSGGVLVLEDVIVDITSGGWITSSFTYDVQIPIRAVRATPGSDVTIVLRSTETPAQTIILSEAGGENPDPSHVREGIAYSWNSLTGTLAVPPANSVASGVPVDNTVGTAALNLGDVAALVGQQIAAAVGTTE